MRVNLLRWLLCVLALMVMGCSPSSNPPATPQPTASATAFSNPPSTPQPTASPAAESALAALPQEWRRNLSQWLELSYVHVQDRDWAGFSQFFTPDLQSPNLYATHGAVVSLVSLGHPPEQPEQIAAWVGSLRSPGGLYAEPDPHNVAADLVDTSAAVEVLTRLGRPIPSKDAVIHALRARQQPNGLFLDAIDKRDASVEFQIARTRTTVKILDALDALDAPMLLKTRDALRDYVATVLAGTDTATQISEPETGSLMLATWSLAMIDENAVPDGAIAFVQDALAQIPSLGDGFYWVFVVQNLLDTAEALGIPAEHSPAVQGHVRQFLIDNVFPLQSSPGGFGRPSAMDPLVTAEVAYLASRVGVPYPNEAELLQQLSLHRIGNGWVLFTSLSLDREARFTYYALHLAEAAGFRQYDEQAVARFLASEMRHFEFNPEHVFFAIRGYKLLQGSLPAELHREVEQDTVAALRDLPADLGYRSAYYYAASIVQELGIALPDDIQDKMANVALMFKEEIEQDEYSRHLVFMFQLWRLQTALPERNIIDQEQVSAFVLGLEHPDGGFRTTASAPAEPPPSWPEEMRETYDPPESISPDMISTHAALSMLGPAAATNRDGIIRFVESMRKEYGFVMSEGWAYPDFLSTFLALGVLEQLS